MKQKRYTLSNQTLIPEDEEFIEVILKIKESDWKFYKDFLELNRDRFLMAIESTVTGPKNIIKIYL